MSRSSKSKWLYRVVIDQTSEEIICDTLVGGRTVARQRGGGTVSRVLRADVDLLDRPDNTPDFRPRQAHHRLPGKSRLKDRVGVRLCPTIGVITDVKGGAV